MSAVRHAVLVALLLLAAGAEIARSIPKSIADPILDILAGFAASAQSPPGPRLTLEPYLLQLGDGAGVDAEHGFILVPENRSDPASRLVELHFVRFVSDAEGPPLVLLMGGPGASGIDAAPGFYPFIQALLEFGDVIALDQRGTGLSSPLPECVTDRRLPIDAPFIAAEVAALERAAAEDCAVFWRESGIDLAGYTAVESAHDIDDLRRALGEEQVSLLGISYGGRLAMTALREMPGGIARAVLISAEPLGGTMLTPASSDAHAARIQAVIDADSGAAAAYPDIAAVIRRTHERLDAEPLMLTAQDGSGEAVAFSWGGEEMRMLGLGGLGEPANAALVVPMYAAMAEGGPPIPAVLPRMLGLRRSFDPITLDGMEAMDFTAGVSAERLARIREQGPASLFGAFQTYEVEVLAGLGLTDLGESYREPVCADVPTLVLTGTLDGRYDPADEAEALSCLSDLTHVTVVNGGHNLLQNGPPVGEPILSFLRGEETPDTVLLPPPTFRY